MGKRPTLASIDVGTTKICTIVAEVNSGDVIRVAGVGIAPSHGLHKGLVGNINDARESSGESESKAAQASGDRVRWTYGCVIGRHAS